MEDSAEDVELTSRALRHGNALNEIVVVSDGVKALDYLLGRPQGWCYAAACIAYGSGRATASE